MSKFNEVVAAINNTKSVDPGYWEKTLLSRLVDGSGSRTFYEKKEELEKALLEALWSPFATKEAVPGCQYYIAHIPGKLGVMCIAPDDGVLLEDPKETGFVSGKLVGEYNDEMISTDHTVLITGPASETDKTLIVWTFHPGPPIQPSRIPSTPELLGKIITGKEAVELGLLYAKI